MAETTNPTPMDEPTYMKERVDNQMNWYDKKSITNQHTFKRYRTIVLILSILIPLMAGFVNQLVWLKYVIGAAGAMVAILEGLITQNKYQENWIQYRITAEALKREKYLYQTQVGTYSQSADAFKEFVLQVEKITSGENAGWSQYIKSKQKKEN
ncbi:MAG: DUF4231 domain-containing protein [Bacteroidota bacterium]